MSEAWSAARDAPGAAALLARHLALTTQILLQQDWPDAASGPAPAA